MHLGSAWSLSSPSDLQHRVQPIIDVHAVYDAMQEIVRLNAIEQLHENVTHAEEHTPDDQEQFHLRIHQGVLIPRSITMYSPFLPLPFHSLLLQVVIGHVSSISLLASSAPDDVSSSLWWTSLHRLRLGRSRSSFSAQLCSSSLWTLLLRSSPSPAQPSPRCSGPFPLLSDTTKKSLHVSRALNGVQHQWL